MEKLMPTLNRIMSEPISPTGQEARIARRSSKALASLMESDRDVCLIVHAEGGSPAEIALPPTAARLLLGALEEIGKGHGVTLIPTDAELTTQQAADLARVSRPFF